MPECVATSLLEGMVKKAKDPVYMEDIVRSTLGSLYTGEQWNLVGMSTSLTVLVLFAAGADTVNTQLRETLY